MTDATKPYTNTTTQAERAETLQNDKAVQRANTFAGRAQAEADEIQGRWAQEHKATVIGSDGAPTYPQLPASSPWHDVVEPVEPPLGFDVNAVEAVGEKFEIEALGDVTTPEASTAVGIAQPQPVALPVAGATAPTSVDDPSTLARAKAPKAVSASPADGEPPAIPNSKPNRRL
jgi:hypothetical protein